MKATIAAWFDVAVWFWAAAAFLWWKTCSATLGAPNDLLVRAGRDPEDAALFDRLARRNVAAHAAAWRNGGVTAAALGAFLVAFAGAYAVIGRSPSAAGAFCLLGPFTLHLFWSARAAERLDAAQPDAETLRKRFLALRTQAFALAMTSVALAALIRGGARLSAMM